MSSANMYTTYTVSVTGASPLTFVVNTEQYGDFTDADAFSLASAAASACGYTLNGSQCTVMRVDYSETEYATDYTALTFS